MTDKTQIDMDHLIGHLASLGAVVGIFMKLLPAFTAFAALVWYAVAIYETKTVQRMIAHWKEKRHARRHGHH
jgi:hypothetical protein